MLPEPRQLYDRLIIGRHVDWRAFHSVRSLLLRAVTNKRACQRRRILFNGPNHDHIVVMFALAVPTSCRVGLLLRLSYQIAYRSISCRSQCDTRTDAYAASMLIVGLDRRTIQWRLNFE